MDKDRQIRFLYPPFFLVFSILLLCYYLEIDVINEINSLMNGSEELSKIFILIFGSGVIIIVVGFFIGTLTINILRLIFFICRFRIPLKNCIYKNYEINLRSDSYTSLKDILTFNEEAIKGKDKFFAGATFDHVIIDKGVHNWLVRRWNAFGVSCNIVMALLISIPISFYFLDLSLNVNWIILIGSIAILFLINAIIAWKHTMGMLDFQVKCDFKDKNTETIINQGKIINN